MKKILGIDLLYYTMLSSLFLLVPTVLPLKSIFFLIVFVYFVFFAVYFGRIALSSNTLLLLLILLSPMISMCFFGSEYSDLSSVVKIPFYIIVNSLPIYFLFRYHFKTLDRVDSFLKIYAYLSVLLAIILILESFGFYFYKDVVGIVSVNADDVTKVFDVSNSFSATSIFGIDFKRPYGPFRYQLIAGYMLIPGYLYLLYKLNLKFSLRILISILLITTAVFMTSKGALIATTAIALLSFDFKNKNFLYKLCLKYPLVILLLLGFSAVVLLPIFLDLEFGSLFERINRISTALNVFMDNGILRIIFGEGLGYTWYGNEVFEYKYQGALADIGFYINGLIQGGVIYIALQFSYLVCVFYGFYRSDKGSFSRLLYSFLVINAILWLTISNPDVIFMVFAFHGLIDSVRKHELYS
ncbi:hypothetical protein [Vibrio mediterranei]|uniref:hypothetical protein n=1 Tax=Vibrio mediterranei TaxID=689 RepID=UPI00406791C5